jgi:membrane protease YdiL (CAAX protease family)
MSDPDAPLRSALAIQVVFVAIAIAGAILVGPRILPRGLLIGRGRLGVLRSSFVVVGFVLLSHGLALLLAQLRWSDSGTLAELERIVGQLRGAGPPDFLLAVVALGLAPALGEELLFRGLIQQSARHWLPTGAAVALGAALFGLLHLDLAQSSAAFLMGLYLGVAVERSGTLRVPMACHGVNNTLGVVLPPAALGSLLEWALPFGLLAAGASAVILLCATRLPPVPAEVPTGHRTGL